MIRQLHQNLKACKCGFIGNRSKLYKHFDLAKKVEGQLDLTKHGEVPLNEDDPRTFTIT